VVISGLCYQEYRTKLRLWQHLAANVPEQRLDGSRDLSNGCPGAWVDSLSRLRAGR
jgi:hypothetical protein